MKLLVLLFCTTLAQAQITTYVSQTGESLGLYKRLAVKECNETQASVNQSYAAFARELASKGYVVALHSELLRVQAKQEKRSWQRNALLGIEIAGWLTTALIASDLIHIKEKYKAAVPLTTGALRLATTVIKVEHEELPALRPSLLQIGPGECKEHVVYTN